MAEVAGIFDVERKGGTLILIPQADLSELEFQHIQTGAKDVLALLGNGSVRNLILDFKRTQFYGSTALGFFVKLWKRVRGQGGTMAFCNVSEPERDILRATKLDALWPVCGSREEAERAVASQGGE